MNIAYKKGLQPVRMKGGGRYSGSTQVYPIKNSDNVAFYEGMPVTVSTNGYLDVAKNTRTAAEIAAGTGSPIGVAMGFSWVDESTRQVRFQNYIPASTSSVGMTDGYSSPVAYVASDPHIVFAIKADLSVPITMNGQLARVTNAATGSTFTGRSNAELATTGTTVSVGDSMFRVVGVLALETNTWDTAETIVEVVFANHALA